jgi:hypothetical protein
MVPSLRRGPNMWRELSGLRRNLDAFAIPLLLHVLLRREQLRHPHPAASQGGVREAAIAEELLPLARCFTDGLRNQAISLIDCRGRSFLSCGYFRVVVDVTELVFG